MSAASVEIDREGLIIALTDGIGSTLGRPVRASFFEVTKRLDKHKDYSPLEKQDKQALVDLLALSIFYNQVISPLESGESLIHIATKADATHIRIGQDELTPHLASRFGACVGSFFKILAEQKIPRRLLTFSTLREFIANYKAARTQKV